MRNGLGRPRPQLRGWVRAEWGRYRTPIDAVQPAAHGLGIAVGAVSVWTASTAGPYRNRSVPTEPDGSSSQPPGYEGYRRLGRVRFPSPLHRQASDAKIRGRRTSCIANTASAAHLRAPRCVGGAALLTCGNTAAGGGSRSHSSSVEGAGISAFSGEAERPRGPRDRGAVAAAALGPVWVTASPRLRDVLACCPGEPSTVTTRPVERRRPRPPGPRLLAWSQGGAGGGSRRARRCCRHVGSPWVGRGEQTRAVPLRRRGRPGRPSHGGGSARQVADPRAAAAALAGRDGCRPTGRYRRTRRWSQRLAPRPVWSIAGSRRPVA